MEGGRGLCPQVFIKFFFSSLQVKRTSPILFPVVHSFEENCLRLIAFSFYQFYTLRIFSSLLQKFIHYLFSWQNREKIKIIIISAFVENTTRRDKRGFFKF